VNRIYANTDSDLPEVLTLNFNSTGPQGGDAGHGGSAILRITSDNGVNSATFYNFNGDQVASIGGDCMPWSVVINAQGDWELNGFAEALIDLGRQIKRQVKADREQRRIIETVSAAVARIKA
jgi:hypothetical protein